MALKLLQKKYSEYDLKPMEVKRILESLGVKFKKPLRGHL